MPSRYLNQDIFSMPIYMATTCLLVRRYDGMGMPPKKGVVPTNSNPSVFCDLEVFYGALGIPTRTGKYLM